MIFPAPSYLTGLVTEVSEATLLEIHKQYGKYTTAFKFNTSFTSLIQTWIKEYDEYGGTIWGVDKSNNQTIIFDQFKNGYNGVMEINEEEDLSSKKGIDLISGTEIIIAFQYSGGEAEYLEDGTSKYEQDYFSWVIVYKYADNKFEELLSYECA
ncbi:hypothetical protein [Flavihumibacter profundi]|uniref:hypothetical protein n=1 Tax=Flavihumibacter profundi TaxID=2716883 RepID=UPI001CC63F8A|nr:hypothetical protein [Flavihumibacter profundi]MBZ5857749.1 hypothetical protein [Flavihumibacter profundi]